MITISISNFLWAGQQGERRAEPMRMLCSPTCPPKIHRAPSHIQLIYCQGKLHPDPRHHAPLKECFTCDFRNNFYMQLSCSFFAIQSMGEKGCSSNNGNDVNGTTASAPLPIGRGGEGPPEGDVVATAHPGGNGRVPHPGVPPISGWKRWRRPHRPRTGGGGWGQGIIGGVGRSLVSVLGTCPFLDLTAEYHVPIK